MTKKQITTHCRKVIKDNPNVVADYKNGIKIAIRFLTGQMMRVTKGTVDPQIAYEILCKLLK